MTFKEQLKKLKPLKVLEEDTKLPYVFDLHWDAKVFSDLIKMDLLGNPEVRRLLAENGFNVNGI